MAVERGKLIVKNGVAGLPVEVIRHQTFVDAIHLGIASIGGHLCAVTGKVEEHNVAIAGVRKQPCEPLANGRSGGAIIERHPNRVGIHAHFLQRLADQKHVVDRPFQRITRIGVFGDTNEQRAKFGAAWCHWHRCDRSDGSVRCFSSSLAPDFAASLGADGCGRGHCDAAHATGTQAEHQLAPALALRLLMLKVMIGVVVDQLKLKRRAHLFESRLPRQRKTAGEHHVIFVVEIPPAREHRRALNAPGEHLAHSRMRDLGADGDEPSVEATEKGLRLVAAQGVVSDQPAQAVRHDHVRFERGDFRCELVAQVNAQIWQRDKLRHHAHGPSVLIG